MIQRKMMTFLWFIGFFGLGISTIYSESTSQPVSKEKGSKDNSAWIPKPLQKGWDATQKKWKQTMDVYQSLKKLLGEDPKDQKKRIRKEEKEKKKERRKMEDLDIEKKVQNEFQISFYKKACQRGSAIACQRELAREPNQLQPQRILKSIYLQRQQYPKALALCKKIEQSGQATIEDILCLADASFYLGKYSQSLRSYYQIIRKNPNVGTVWLSIGKVLLQQKKYSNGRVACLKASILIPKNPWVWNCLGHHSLALQEKEKAKESFQKACLFGDSSSCKVFFHLQERTLGGIWEVGKVWTQVGSSSLSKNTLQASCQLGLKTACHSLSIDLLKSAKEWEEQLQFYKANLLYHKATQVSPQHALSWKKKGLFFMRQRWWKEACSAFKKSLGLDHKQPFVWNQLADCYRSYAKILFQKQNRAYFQACRLGEEKACKKILKHKSK